MSETRMEHSFWFKIKNSLLENIPEIDNLEFSRKVVLMYGIGSLGIAVLILLGGIAFLQGAAFLGTLDFSVAAILTTFLLLMRYKKFHFAYIYIGIAIMGILYASIFIMGGVNGTAFMWYYTFPLFVHFLLGPRQGLIASLLLLIPAVMFLVIDLSSTNINIYSVDFAYRFVPSYLTVVFFAYMYERCRTGSYQAWIQIQNKLERLVDERTATLNLEIERRKNRESALHASEQRLSLALKGAKCGLWDWNIQEEDIYFDPNYYLIAGYEPDEFPHNYQEWRKRVHPEDIALIEKSIQHYLAGQYDSYAVDFRFKKKNEEWMWILGQGEIVERNEEGLPVRFAGLHIDISEQKQAEEQRSELESQLRQKFKMEAVGVMAGGIAHNFNNNLSIILGNVELAQLKQSPDSDATEMLQNAKIAILRSRDLVKQILTYSRKGIHTKTPLQLPLIIDETIKLLHSAIPTTVNLQQVISEESHHLNINADSSQIQEALINLCNNAVHAMNEKGELKILLDRVELDQQDIPLHSDQNPGSYLKLSVQDSGSGIASDTMDKIFDPFFTTKEVDKGTGMGLSTVQGIVEQHNGLIKVKSTLGKGSTFDLYFPIVEIALETVDSTPTDTDLPEGTERILIVDDEEMLANLGELMLSQVGYQVTSETSSRKALEIFRKNPHLFDLVITDQTMPELCGKDLIQELLKISPDLPTILYSGHSNLIDEDTAKNLGAKAFLMKPLNLQQLLQVTRRVLDEGKA